MITPCIAKQGGALAFGTLALAEVTPPDLYPMWEKGGMIAVLLFIMVVLWGASRSDQAKAEKRRNERESEMRKWREEDLRHRETRDARDQARHDEMVAALSEVKRSVSENAIRCDARRAVIEGMVAQAVTSKAHKRKGE